MVSAAAFSSKHKLWSLNRWECVTPCSSNVHEVSKKVPAAISIAVVLVIVSYVVPELPFLQCLRPCLWACIFCLRGCMCMLRGRMHAIVCAYTRAHARAFVCVCKVVHACGLERWRMRAFVHLCVRACVRACMCMCTHVHACIRVRTCALLACILAEHVSVAVPGHAHDPILENRDTLHRTFLFCTLWV